MSDASGATLPNNGVLTIKGGAFKLDDDHQTFNNINWHFESPHAFYAIEGEGWSDPEKQVTIGGEFMHYSSAFKQESPAGTGRDTLEVRTFMARTKYFFGSRDSALRPYLGIGIGLALATDGHGPIEGSPDGFAAQGIVGIQLRSHRAGIRAEYVRLHTNLEDNNSQKVPVSGNAFLVGMSFFFGRAQ